MFTLFKSRSLVPALVDGGKHQDAADMLIAHLADYGAAIPIMCDAKMYATALYLARIHAEHLVGEFRVGVLACPYSSKNVLYLNRNYCGF